MKKFVQIFVIITLLSLPSLAQKQFEIETILQKDTFLVGEQVILGLGFNNITNADQKITRGTFEAKLYDSTNSIVERTNLGMGYDFMEENDVFSKGRIDFNVFDLNEMFGNQRFDGFSLTHYFSAGKYQLKLKLTGPNNFIEEKTVSFCVTEPQGDESVFFNRLKNILSIYKNPKSNNYSFIEQLEQLHKEYPNSIYAPTILMFLHNRLLFGGTTPEYEKAAFYYKELIENYPWSGFGFVGICQIIRDEKKSSREKVDYLTKLLKKSGNSPMAKWIELSIKGLVGEIKYNIELR